MSTRETPRRASLPDVDARKAAPLLALPERLSRMGAMFARARALVLGALLTTAAACITSMPGETRTTAESSLVTIGAGRAEIGGGYYRVWYLIDKQTQTCWMKLGDAGGQLDCCALRRVSEAQPYITWTSCPDDVQRSPAIAPGGPASSAAAAASSPNAHCAAAAPPRS
jgi:hypothetical protein